MAPIKIKEIDIKAYNNFVSVTAAANTPPTAAATTPVTAAATARNTTDTSSDDY